MVLFNFLKTVANRQKTTKGKSRKKSKKRTARRAQKKKAQKKIKKKKQRKTAQKVQAKKAQKRPRKTPQRKKSSKYTEKLSEKIKEKELGVITHYFGNISVGIIKLKSGLRTGDEIHIKGAHDDFTQTVTSMQLNHKDISYGKKGDEVGIKVPQRVHENDKVYKTAGK